MQHTNSFSLVVGEEDGVDSAVRNVAAYRQLKTPQSGLKHN